jgi:NAD(P)-dependent dehydrogenase (short-subunit alcohol dehydrogenase family)
VTEVTPKRVLADRCALISGASRGLGLEIARYYVRAGASVAICARDASTLGEAARSLRELAGAGQRVAALAVDVGRPADVAQLTEFAVRELGRLDILVNNAGIAGASGALEDTDWLEWVRAIEVNLLGSVLLCRAALPYFKRARRGKIIQISGGGATQPLPGLGAYAASKAAVVRFAETLAEETRQYQIDVNALSPGLLDTALLKQMLAAGPEKLGPELHARMQQQQRTGTVPLSKGAELAVFLGSSASDGITGKLLSAVWDPWQELPRHLSDLQRTDVYTLRRIQPADRDLDWGETP